MLSPSHWTAREFPSILCLFCLFMAGPGLNCSTWESFFFSLDACELLVVACGVQFPNQGLKLDPLHWERSLSHWTTREVPSSVS